MDSPLVGMPKACTDALVAFHYQRNLKIVGADQCLLEAQVVPVQLTLKQFSGTLWEGGQAETQETCSIHSETVRLPTTKTIHESEKQLSSSAESAVTCLTHSLR